MRLVESVIPKDCKIVIMGCMHSGAANCHWSGIKKAVDRIQDDEVFGMLNTGDNIEGKIPNDKHFSRSSIDLKRVLITPQEQAEAIVKVMSPVKNKILVWGRGNHERKIENTWDAGKEISKMLGVQYGMFNYKFIATDKKGAVRFKIHIHHGSRNIKSNAKDTIQRRANKEAALRQLYIGTGISDCVLHAGSHWHQQIISPPPYALERHIGDNGSKITTFTRKPAPQNEDYISPEQRWVASVGCFRKTFTQPDDMMDDYAEVSMYSGAADLGWTEVEIKDYQVVDVKAVSV